MGKRTLPERILVGPDQWFPVVIKDCSPKLGWLDEGGHIAIHEGQPEAGKHQILLHEILHAAFIKLQAAGVIKRHPKEELVQELSGALLPILVGSGLWNGISMEELQQLYEVASAK